VSPHGEPAAAGRGFGAPFPLLAALISFLPFPILAAAVPSYQNEIHEERKPETQEEACYRLWRAVTWDAVATLLKGWPGAEARGFLFDAENYFLNCVLEYLRVNPESARAHLRQVLKRRARLAEVESLGPGQGKDTG